MSRKRDKPYTSRHIPYSYPKRRRPPAPHPPSPTHDPPSEKPPPPPALLVIGLPTGCSVLDLKARFEIYGPISRIRIDPEGVGFVSFRSKSSADSALAASLDSSFGISVDSHQVQLMWASEMKAGESTNDREERDRRNNSMSSKLLKGETPLSRHGRLKNRLSSAIVNPNNRSSSSNSNSNSNSSVLDPPFHAREIVAYDDIL